MSAQPDLNTEPVDAIVPSPGVTPGSSLAVACIFVCFGLFITFGVVAPVLNIAYGLWFTSIFVFFAVAWELTRLSGRDPATYTGLKHFSPVAVAIGVGLGLVNFLAVAGPLRLLSHFWVEPFLPYWLKQDSTALFDSTSKFELAMIVLAVGIGAPVAEEFAFRGVIQQSWAQDGRRTRALILTAVIFSAFHLDGLGFVPRAELGILFGLLFFTSRSIWPGVAAHATNNLVSVGIYLLAPSTEIDSKVPPWWGVVLYTLLGMLVLIGLWIQAAPILAKNAQPLMSAQLSKPPASLRPAMGKWTLGVLLSLGLLLAVDYRGVVLNWEDIEHPLSHQKDTEAARADLLTLRASVRRGDAPMEAYRSRHKAMWSAERAAHGKQR
jgi:membrane protease YdiL (CAAX protease family)